MQQIVIYSISCISTCFGRLYAHRQGSRLRFTAYGFQHWLLLFVVLESKLRALWRGCFTLYIL
jgi:hypothetical protein